MHNDRIKVRHFYSVVLSSYHVLGILRSLQVIILCNASSEMQKAHEPNKRKKMKQTEKWKSKSL